MKTRAMALSILLLLAAMCATYAVADDATPSPSMASDALTAHAEDIRDIRPPIPIPEPTRWRPWLLGGGGALALALLAISLLRRRRAPALGLTEGTLARLRAARTHIASGDAYAFAIHLSEILRQYLEARFGLRATRQTTSEFLRELATRDIPEVADSHDLLHAFLEGCDAAKYARYALGRSRMEAMADDAARFVEANRPAPRPARGAPASSAAAPELAPTPEGGAA